MSTVGPKAIRSAAALAAPAELLDVPVTGGPDRARDGTLVVMAGGDAAALDRAEPLLRVLAKEVVRCGGAVGDGQAVKLVNQLLAGVHIVAAAEALSYARALGLDEELVLGVVTSGAAASFMLEDRGPRMIAGDFVPPRTGIDIFVKDLELVLEAARDAGFEPHFARTAAGAFAAAAACATERVDDAAVIDVYRHPR